MTMEKFWKSVAERSADVALEAGILAGMVDAIAGETQITDGLRKVITDCREVCAFAYDRMDELNYKESKSDISGA